MRTGNILRAGRKSPTRTRELTLRTRRRSADLDWQPNCKYVEAGLIDQNTTTRPGFVLFPAMEPKMQVVLLVGSIVLSVGAALGTASLFLSLLLRVMSKLR